MNYQDHLIAYMDTNTYMKINATVFAIEQVIGIKI